MKLENRKTKLNNSLRNSQGKKTLMCLFLQSAGVELYEVWQKGRETVINPAHHAKTMMQQSASSD